MFSLDVIGDEVNDILVSLVFRAARSAADFSPIDSVCAYLPCTVGVRGRGTPAQCSVSSAYPRLMPSYWLAKP